MSRDPEAGAKSAEAFRLGVIDAVRHRAGKHERTVRAIFGPPAPTAAPPELTLAIHERVAAEQSRRAALAALERQRQQ